MSTEGQSFVDLDKFHSLMRRALGRTYAVNRRFDNESDFKFELFHQLHQMKLNGRSLGVKWPGSPTCAMHAEAKAENGNPSKADILICNPTRPNGFNYMTEVIIELKDTLNVRALRTELEKFATYTVRSIRRLYLIPANKTTLTDPQKSDILAEYCRSSRSLTILDRSSVESRRARKARDSGDSRPLADHVSECVRQTLNLYGKNRKQYHGFFWCNYEHETNKGWTFPVEGDFNAQLYHRLRTNLPAAEIRTEYRPSSAVRSRVDFFISNSGESVGLEVKMNWDQFRFQPRKKKQETDAIMEKFDAMKHDHGSHSNLLVVIQGEDGHKSNNKAEALKRLQGEDLSLFYYDEIRNTPVGRTAISPYPPVFSRLLPDGSSGSPQSDETVS